jgi:hypothetical protein
MPIKNVVQIIGSALLWIGLYLLFGHFGMIGGERIAATTAIALGLGLLAEVAGG